MASLHVELRYLLLILYSCTLDPLDDLRKSLFADALSWNEDDGTAKLVGGQGNRVVSLSSMPRMM